MKVFLKKTLLGGILVLFFQLSALAQDYVITIKGDTLHCRISIPLMGKLRYKSEGMTSAEKIKPDEILEYYIARKDLLERSVSINNNKNMSPVFMTVVEKGKISLYQLIVTTTFYNNGMTSSSSTTTWYIGKGSGDVDELKTSGLFSMASRKSRKDELGQLFADNKEVYDKYIADDKFSFTQIRNLVHLYNTGEPLKN